MGSTLKNDGQGIRFWLGCGGCAKVVAENSVATQGGEGGGSRCERRSSTNKENSSQVVESEFCRSEGLGGGVEENSGGKSKGSGQDTFCWAA